jgi:hypothetical protein
VRIHWLSNRSTACAASSRLYSPRWLANITKKDKNLLFAASPTTTATNTLLLQQQQLLLKYIIIYSTYIFIYKLIVCIYYSGLIASVLEELAIFYALDKISFFSRHPKKRKNCVSAPRLSALPESLRLFVLWFSNASVSTRGVPYHAPKTCLAFLTFADLPWITNMLATLVAAKPLRKWRMRKMEFPIVRNILTKNSNHPYSC